MILALLKKTKEEVFTWKKALALIPKSIWSPSVNQNIKSKSLSKSSISSIAIMMECSPLWIYVSVSEIMEIISLDDHSFLSRCPFLIQMKEVKSPLMNLSNWWLVDPVKLIQKKISTEFLRISIKITKDSLIKTIWWKLHKNWEKK